MKITDALLGEHGILYVLMDACQAALDGHAPSGSAAGPWRSGAANGPPGPEAVATVTRLLRAALPAHARIENELLLDEAARRRTPADRGPLDVMREEHDLIEELLDEAGASLEEGESERCRALLAEAMRTARDHFRKEEVAAFPAAERLLGEETLRELGRAWAERRGLTEI